MNGQMWGVAKQLHTVEHAFEVPYMLLCPTHQKFAEVRKNLRYLGQGYINALLQKKLFNIVFKKIREVQDGEETSFPNDPSTGWYPGATVETPPTGSVPASIVTAASAITKACGADQRLISGLYMQARSLHVFMCNYTGDYFRAV